MLSFITFSPLFIYFIFPCCFSASPACFLRCVFMCVFPPVSFSFCIHASHKPSCLFALVAWQLNSSWVSGCCDPVSKHLFGKSQHRPPLHLSRSTVSTLPRFCVVSSWHLKHFILLSSVSSGSVERCPLVHVYLLVLIGNGVLKTVVNDTGKLIIRIIIVFCSIKNSLYWNEVSQTMKNSQETSSPYLGIKAVISVLLK